MSTYLEIPLQPTPQFFTTTILGVDYQFTIKWNKMMACWVLDIADDGGNPIVSGIPMVTGADLLGQYQYIGFGFNLVCQTDHEPDAIATFSNLGTTSHLYVITP